jgi:hypothetical protein
MPLEGRTLRRRGALLEFGLVQLSGFDRPVTEHEIGGPRRHQIP